MKTTIDVDALAGRLAAQDFLIGHLFSLVIAAGITSWADLADDLDAQAAKLTDRAAATVLRFRAAALRGSAQSSQARKPPKG